MRYEDVYPVVFVHDLSTTTEFYSRTLGLDVIFRADFFVLLALPGESRAAVGFVLEDHPTSPPEGRAATPGSSVFLTLHVADAAEAYEQLVQGGTVISYQLRDEPWGQRRFGVQDPNGLYVDIVEQIQPSPDFWPRYGVSD
ncbi:glyoxalase superfamily protein [Microbacterium sp. NPDC019599]|uniref:glyoxalase superfamily protein n=1 Tax=Microbacterium sp. NPDC019599 TaxID=3154690 RepID=UPI0033F06695